MRKLLITICILGVLSVALAIKNGVRYNAKALNWDNEKTYDVQVEFCKNGIEATIYFSDGWHEPRILTLLYPSKDKDPKKIETVDIERDVFWDIEVKQ